jgi:hypothetical protein
MEFSESKSAVPVRTVFGACELCEFRVSQAALPAGLYGMPTAAG